MFKSLQNIETAFRLIRTVVIMVIVGSLFFAGYVKYSSDQQIELSRHNVYVISDGKALMLALSQDMAVNRPAEARHHITMFHELFFALSPNNDAINHNIQRALELADKSAYKLFQDLREQGYYRRLINNNILQRIDIDSVVCNMDIFPYQAKTYAKISIIRESVITWRSLITTCLLNDAKRSDSNPHGFLITNFKVIENNELSREKR